MTTPFQFPNIRQGQTINDPGTGAVVAHGIAGVLAAIQQQKENEYRQQQMQQAAAQQQMMQQYYQGTLDVQRGQLSAQTTESAAKIAGQRQVGGAMQAALGVGQPSPQQVPSQPTMQPGNATQSMQPGVFHEVLGSAAQQLQPGMGQIFQGVDPENMPAAVEGVGQVQGLQPKPAELPNAAKEFMFAAQLSPELQKYFVENWVNPPKQPGVTVNVGGEPTPFSKKFDESQAETTVAASTSAKEAYRAMPIISEAYKTLTQGKVLTGLFAKPSLAAARMAAAMGVDEAKIKTADTQTMLKLTGEMTFVYLRSRDLGSGTAVSDGDRLFVYELSGRDLSQDKLALKRTLRINFGATMMKQDDAVEQLRMDAAGYPERAQHIGREINAIERRKDTAWRTYARMLREEGATDEDLRARMIGSGVRDVETIMKSLPPLSIQKLGDDVFGPRR